MTDSLWILVGRFHPVLVHFPIALLIVGAGLRLWGLARGARDGAADQVQAGRTLIALGAVAALVATIAGLAHADDGQFRGAALEAVLAHRNAAFLATGAAILAALVDRFRVGPASGALALALVTAGLVGYAGHLGGVSVYGPDHYAIERGPDDASPAQPVVQVPAGAAIVFARDVRPIFEMRCYRCHDGRKRKGGLRLDKKKYFDQGGDGGPAVVAGRPMASKLFQMINLPVDHEDYMPSKGDPIPPTEVEIIGRWITQGAVWPADGG